jgi:RimJ/RimL family protein N-acetyltransferase
MEEINARIELYRRQHQEHGFSFWALERRIDGLVIGGCGLFPIGWKGPDIEIAWHIRRNCWGRGYASEAAHAVLEHGLRDLGINRIWAILSPENPASRRVAERAGMDYVGLGGYKDLPHEYYILPKGSGDKPPQGPRVIPPE